MQSELRRNLLNLSDELDTGETVYVECISCGGDGKTLALTKFPDRLVYVCHRDKCQIKGKLTYSYSPNSPSEKLISKGKPPARVKYEQVLKGLSTIPLAVQEVVSKKYSFTIKHLAKGGWLWHEGRERLWMPYLDTRGREIGGVLRTLDPDVQPKALGVPAREEYPRMCWFEGPSPVVIIVEDIPSALRASMYVHACALMGTSMSDDVAMAIRTTKPPSVVIALDNDAYTTGIAMHKKYGYLFNSCFVVRPPKDLKDMTEEELEHFLNTEVL